MKPTCLRLLAAWTALAGPALLARAQQGAASFSRASHVVPSARSFAAPGVEAVRTTHVQARIELLEGVARTTLDVHLQNPGPRLAEATLLLPLPRDAAVMGFDFQGNSLEPTAELLDAEEARRTYRSIVDRLRDPALLEFAGTALLRSSVFPVPARGTQALRVVFEQVLEGGETYVLPRSESLSGVVPWTLEVHASEGHVYSPSHALERVPGSRVLRSSAASAQQPGPVRLVHLRPGREPLGATVLACPDHEGGGHFLFLAAPVQAGKAQATIPRSVTLVLDRSGSMAGGKLHQAVTAVLRMVEGLDVRETFNVIDYGSQVARFAPAPVVASPGNKHALAEYLRRLTPSGGTNLHDALALGLESALVERAREPGRLPIVVLLSDGVATVGETRGEKLRALAASLCPRVELRPRVFTVGIGHDVDAPLLDALASASRGVPTYVLPGEDVTASMAELTKKLHGPLWADLEWEVRGADGIVTTRDLRDVHPAPLPDLFEGDALVVLGRYEQEIELEFLLKGRGPEGVCVQRIRFDLRRADQGSAHTSVRHAFVPRLWAVREIAALVDALRLTGDGLVEPARRELREEILRLSTRYGVLSEYTAFLATEGTDLGDWSALVRDAEENLVQAAESRSGGWAVNQSRNMIESRGKATLDYSNAYWNAKGQRQQVQGVQQLGDGAFLNRGGRWIDSRLVLDDQAAASNTRTVRPGDAEYGRLLGELDRLGRAGWMSLPGEILLQHRGKPVLIQNHMP